MTSVLSLWSERGFGIHEPPEYGFVRLKIFVIKHKHNFMNFKPLQKKRLFVGIPITDELKNKLKNSIQQNISFPFCRWVPMEHYHVTTLFLGPVNENEIDQIREIIQETCLATKPFTLQFDSFTSAPKKSPYMIWAKFNRHKTFDHIVLKLSKSLTPSKKHKPKPVPHITLCRLRKFKPLGNFNDSQLKSQYILVNKLILWESITNEKGVTYDEIDRFQLSINKKRILTNSGL